MPAGAPAVRARFRSDRPSRSAAMTGPSCKTAFSDTADVLGEGRAYRRKPRVLAGPFAERASSRAWTGIWVLRGTGTSEGIWRVQPEFV